MVDPQPQRPLISSFREPLESVLARRRVPDPPTGNVPADLLEGRSPADVAERRGLPLAAVEGTLSFYEGVGRGPQVCDGTACHVAGSHLLAAELARERPVTWVRCLGCCYQAPALRSGDAVFAKPPAASLEDWFATWGGTGEPSGAPAPIPRVTLATPAVVLRHLIGSDPAPRFEDYALPEGDAILEAVGASGLRGRGGAAFPTAAKWQVARDTPAIERIVVANGDEGDPGSFVDRLLLEEDPHAVLAGMKACARAIRARRGIVYVRAEYPAAQRTMRRAIDEARAAGHLGAAFDVELVSGAGSYVCGEETALLESIEGRRGEPRLKPPYPAVAGLFGHPTVIQNVETLSIVPWIAKTGRGAGHKALCVSGAVARPGVVEIVLGLTLREVLERGAGGARPGSAWTMALVGGPLGRVLPAAEFDTPLAYDTLPGLGHGGVVVFDASVTPRALAEHLFDFARAESCGSCTPCRVGTARLAEARSRADLERLLLTLEMGSRCGFGQSVPRPVRDLLRHFPGELAP